MNIAPVVVILCCSTLQVNKEEALKLQLAEVEEMLLKELATSEGNILENQSLLNSLAETKAKAHNISEGLAESLHLQTSLNADRDAYLPLAQAAAQMFFVVGDLCKINPMYRFSLQSFTTLFIQV